MAPGTIYCLGFTVNTKEFQIQHMIVLLKSHVQFDGKKLCSLGSGIHAQFGEKKLYQYVLLWNTCTICCEKALSIPQFS
jgi:hypothetical protein